MISENRNPDAIYFNSYLIKMEAFLWILLKKLIEICFALKQYLPIINPSDRQKCFAEMSPLFCVGLSFQMKKIYKDFHKKYGVKHENAVRKNLSMKNAVYKN